MSAGGFASAGAGGRRAPAGEGRRETRARLVAAPLILAVILGVIWVQHATGSRIGTQLLVILLAALAGAEMALLFRAAGKPAAPREAAVGCALLASIGLLSMATGLPVAVLRTVVVAALFVGLLVCHLRDVRPEAVASIATRCMPLLYVGFLFSFVIESSHDARGLVLLVVAAKASDMAGWAVGVPFGRHKMIPSVSPGKSWEGTVAGVLASVLAAILLPHALGHPVPPDALRMGLFGLVVGCASVLAGVTWSGWKRRLGAKDSSPLVPAMGGVLDMVDSLLLAAPAALLFTLLWEALA